MLYDDKLVHFIVTRPEWKNGSNKWLEKLQKKIDSKINLINLPFQTFDLCSKKFFLLKLLKWLKKRKIKKIILFTSPASVEAVNKIFDEIKIKCSKNSKTKIAFNLVLLLINNFLKTKKIRFAAIGESTAEKIINLSSRYFEKNSLKISDIYYVKRNATGKEWVNSFSSKITNFDVMLIEGAGNNDNLFKNLRKYTIRLERFIPYKKNFITSADFERKINFFSKFTDNNVGGCNFSSKKFFILISASNFIKPFFIFLKKEGIPINLFTIVAHHTQIIDKVKEIDSDINCKKILSLNTDVIAKEMNNLI